MKFIVPSFLYVFMMVLSNSMVYGYEPDENEQCKEWSNRGECDKNPNYMLKHCATSCGEITDAILAEKQQLESIASVFDISVNDIDGNTIVMNQYKDQVTIIVNVASYCGYTESHYNGLNELYKLIQSNSNMNEKINILAFPCNQFGQQEPGSANDIKQFVQEKNVQFTMMEKINVNGPTAHILYKYLKYKTNSADITWNFATYFIIAPDGTITHYNGVTPMELQPIIFSYFKDEL